MIHDRFRLFPTIRMLKSMGRWTLKNAYGRKSDSVRKNKDGRLKGRDNNGHGTKTLSPLFSMTVPDRLHDRF